MKTVRYKRLSSVEDGEDADFVPSRESPTLRTNVIVGFLMIFGFVICMILLTNGQSKSTGISIAPVTTTVKEFISHKIGMTKKEYTGFQDFYFTKEEGEHLNCSRFFADDKAAIDEYVNQGRMKLTKERVMDLPMDCESIRHRVHGEVTEFTKLSRSMAFVRTIYELYEMQEALLSISYHPDNIYCYVMDSKSTPILKEDIRQMASCFDNVVVLQKEYDFNSGGHGQDKAHFDCLEHVMDRKWEHALILQNFDLIIKTPEQLATVSELLNTTSIMGMDFGFNYRYNTKLNWTPIGLQLFKDEKGVANETLYKKLVVRKSLNEVILARRFVESIFDKLNLKHLMDLFDNNDMYGVDEMLVQTLYENNLGLEGQMETDCKSQHGDPLTRMTHWDWSGPNGYDKDCHSKFKRHGICVLGVEYLNELVKSQAIVANKVMAKFDFGTIICTKEMMIKKMTGKTPDDNFLTSFPQYREMKLKHQGKFNKTAFIC